MSAWIVNRDHLDLLLTAAIAWNLATVDSATDTGRMLWGENLASVAYLYPGDRDGERLGPVDFRDGDATCYEFRPYPGRVDPEVVTTAAKSLAYQSCEHPGWVDTAARAWIDQLATAANERIPGYLAEHGPVNVSRQTAGDNGWYVLVDIHGHRQITSSHGWNVPDRAVFTRAAALRIAPVAPAT